MTIHTPTIQSQMNDAKVAVNTLEALNLEVPSKLQNIARGETWEFDAGLTITEACQIASICAAQLQPGAGTSFHAEFSGEYINAIRGESPEVIFMRYSYESKLRFLRSTLRGLIEDCQGDEMKTGLELAYDKVEAIF